MRTKVYISGPMTGSGTMAENVANGITAARALIAAGFSPLCPQLTHYIDPNNETPHDVWMEVDLPWVEVADAVLRLPGRSSGADIEVRHAMECEIPVFESVDALAEYFGEASE